MAATALPAPRRLGRVLALRRAAVAVVVVCGASVVVGLVLAALNAGTPLPDGADWRVAGLGAIVFFVCGALLALRRPDDALSWVALIAGATQVVGYGVNEYAVYALLTDPGSLPGGDWAQWFSVVVWMPGYLVIATLLLLLFPTGRPPSPRWEAVGWVSLAVIAVTTLGWAVTPWDDLGEPVSVPAAPNPVAWPEAASALAWTPFLLIPCVALCVASLVRRVRQSTGEERQQLRWAGAGVALALLFAAAGYAIDGAAPFTVAFALAVLPACVTVAVLRHGLWELGPLARRSVVAVALSAVVLAVYGLATLVLGGGEVVATAVVAVLLLPLRSRLERFVNRLLYGDRDEPWVAVRRLGERLATPVSPAGIAEEVSRALRLPHVEILAPDARHERVAASSTTAAAGTLAVPLVFHGALVGTLIAGGREVGPADARALEDLAPSLAAAVHAVRLADDLRASRERIVSAREEERRRLRADLHDDVGPSLAMLALRLDVAAGQPSDPATLRELAGQTREALARVRQIVSDLRPAALADLGLSAALEEAVRQVPGARLEVPAPLGALPAATEVAAYRIVREALANVVRHARASSCVVTLARQGDELVATVADDGRGIAPDAPRGVGLGSMAERADELGGTLVVTTRPELAGTRIEARLPA